VGEKEGLPVSFKSVEPSGTDEDIVAEINVTPLTDIFLVLLIIFMVTSTALMQQGTTVQLPRARAGQSVSPGVIITATADGKVEVNGKQVPWPQLRESIRAALSHSEQPSVVLQGDRAVVLERAVQILTLAREAGAEKVSIATVPLEGAEH
jgi:biopolymer transport protein ExbD